MTKRITFVIDVGDPSSAEYFKTTWDIDKLVAEISAADKTVAASMFVGKLEDAPESWAYVLYIDDAALKERVQVPAMKQRLARTLGTDLRLMVAGTIAEYYGMLGAMDPVARRWSAKEPGELYVKRDVAKKLKWPVRNADPDAKFVRTIDAVKRPLPTLILKYLEAALEPPA